VTDEIRALLVRVASEWLTFERLRQELTDLGATDPVIVSEADRDVGRAVALLLAPTRPAAEVERTTFALFRSLITHPDVARVRYQADGDPEANEAGDSALQSMLLARDDVFARWGDFLIGMQCVGPTICQVLIGGQRVGTGFLISDRHVLTAHHCVESLIDPHLGVTLPNSAARLTFVFDDVALGGHTLQSVFNAAAQWLTFDSKQDDGERGPLVDPPQVVEKDRLDFAVICLSTAAGLTAPLYQKSSPRNWINIQNLAAQPVQDTQMLIAHHPGGADLRLSVGLYADLSNCQQRIRYRTPTVVGSSGAPCFTVDWKPYALHNAGFPKARRNQGVPLALIVNQMGGLQALRDAQATKQRLLPAVTETSDPILDREELARHVDAILDGASTELALVVTSRDQGGKTVTAELVKSMVIARGHSAFLFDAEKFVADAPEVFATRLVREIAGDHGGVPQPSSPDSRQRARWISLSLAEWTRTSAGRTPVAASAAAGVTAAPLADVGQRSPDGRTVWVILDRCDKAVFTPETHDLLVAMLSDTESKSTQPLRFLLMGYTADMSSVPASRLWQTRLDLVSADGVLPFMQYVLSSLCVVEEPAVTRKGASDWVNFLATVGISAIPTVVQALQRWREQRTQATRSAQSPVEAVQS